MDIPLPNDMRLALPPSPVDYVRPVTAPDGSTGYDRPLANYFDFDMGNRLLPAQQSGKLYDAIANAHDTCFHMSRGMFGANAPVDWSKCPPGVGRERLRQEAILYEDSPDYLGLCSERSGWRPRRTSHEDTRGVVPVTLTEVNSLLPPPEPEGTIVPSLSSVWFEETATGPVAEYVQPVDTQPHVSDADDEMDWGYSTDSTVDRAPAVVVPLVTSRRQSLPTADSDAESSDDASFDTDTDTESDDGYDWSSPNISAASPSALSNVPKWIIPRKRPSVIITDGHGRANKENDSFLAESTPSESSTLVSPTDSDVPRKQGTKRKPRKLTAPRRPAKKAKKVEDVTARESSSFGMDEQPHYSDTTIADTPRDVSVTPNGSIPPDPISRAQSTTPPVCHAVSRETSPTTAHQIHPRPSKHGSSQMKLSFPCLLDGCTQVCSSAGDLMRHQQSLRHRQPEFTCRGCQHAFTRPDALKRHLNSKPRCKVVHRATTAVDSEVEAEQP